MSKNKISKRINKKTSSYLVNTINIAKKNNHLELAKKLSCPARQRKILNIEQLDKQKEDKLIVVGKVLGLGEIKRKISVCALEFSESAKEKLKKAGCEIKTIKEEIERNPELNGVKII
jgi:large subunit ribosomal protein L18e